MTWIGWPLLGWLTASPLVALVFGRITAAREARESPRSPGIATVVDLAERRARDLGDAERIYAPNVRCGSAAVRDDPLVEPPVRIELTTARLQGECSTTELRRH